MNGVSLNKSRDKWLAQLQYDKEKKILGIFDTEEEAIQARLNALKELVANHPEWTAVRKARMLKGMSLKEMAELLSISYQVALRLDSEELKKWNWQMPTILRFINQGVPTFKDTETFTYFRNQLGLSQQQLCERVGISRRSYQNWESGSAECPALTKNVILAIMKEMTNSIT